MRKRSSEDGHDLIADEFVNHSFILINDGGHSFEACIEDRGDVFRIELLGESCEAAHIREDHCDKSSFTFERLTLAEYAFGKLRRKIFGEKRGLDEEAWMRRGIGCQWSERRLVTVVFA